VVQNTAALFLGGIGARTALAAIGLSILQARLGLAAFVLREPFHPLRETLQKFES